MRVMKHVMRKNPTYCLATDNARTIAGIMRDQHTA
jgi:hypothetical protein